MMPTRSLNQMTENDRNIRNTGERLMRVEVLLHNMLDSFTERFDRLEAGYNKRFDQIRVEQDCIKVEIQALKDVEGKRLVGLKGKAIEYLMIAALGGIIGILTKMLFTGGA